MPFDPKKKAQRPPGPPDYRQTTTIDLIDAGVVNLNKIIMSATNNDIEIRPILAKIVECGNAAKSWVLTN